MAGVICYSVQLTQRKQLTQDSKVNNMDKKNIKVRDLKPTKDAKGSGRNLQGKSTQSKSTQGKSTQGKSKSVR